MAYFALPSLTLPSYRFDYHSRFAGILPVEDAASVASDALQLQVAYKVQGRDGTAEVQATVAIPQGRQLSLAGLFGGAADDAQAGRGVLSLFLKALLLMEQSNPLASLAASGNRARYERGECIAEDIYIACVCLTRWLGLNLRRGIAATDPVLYKTVRDALEGLAKGAKPNTPNAAATLDQLMPALRYFNRKIYSAGQYTPFDDAYFARSFAIDKLRAEPDGETRYLQWMAMSLLYLEQQGVAHLQTAIGADEIHAANAVAASYNQARQTQYKLLAQTAAGGAEVLERDLGSRILPLFEDPALGEVIGIDLSVSENRDGHYAELFAFLTAQLQLQPGPELTRFFGAGAGTRAVQLTNHLQCGGGMGVCSDNRSAIGYAMAYSLRLPGTGFYRAYSDYVFACLGAAKGRQAEDARDVAGTSAHRAYDAAGLLEEMFRDDRLTCDGLTLRRYAVASAHTRERVDAAGKRNTMALCESFDLPSSEQGPSYYELLTANASLLGFRLGDACHYRSFVAAKYPFIAFDTHPSAGFASAEGERFDGYVDTDVLRAAADTLMFAGLQALNGIQIAQLVSLVRSAASLDELFVAGKPVIQEQLAAAMALIGSVANLDRAYAAFQTLVETLVGDSGLRSLWFAALTRVLNLFINWRSYLLGSDAQGVEHSDIQEEFLRTVVLLAYELVPFDASAPGQANLGVQLQQLVASVSAAYWQATVGPLAGLAGTRQITAAIAGYKAPASVVTVTRKPSPA
ncbi:hypothetical protein [Lysobacter sp. CA196]|uniref:hypothetical protein n=1 Tax=Lysobacter sp. CA196 TaxID=3455606 RepID=UPI003F8D0703